MCWRNKEDVNTKEERMKNLNKIMKNVAIKIRIIKAMVLPRFVTSDYKNCTQRKRNKNKATGK